MRVDKATEGPARWLPIIVLGTLMVGACEAEKSASGPSDAGPATAGSTLSCSFAVACITDCGEPPTMRCSCPPGEFPEVECGPQGEGIEAPTY